MLEVVKFNVDFLGFLVELVLKFLDGVEELFFLFLFVDYAILYVEQKLFGLH